jgi:predicted phosphodiesterase
MYKNFISATKDVIENKTNAAGIFINGDCANQYGLRPDYTVLAELLEPLSKAEFTIHMTMGNHDHRGRFMDVLKEHLPNHNPRVGRRIGVVEAKHANWFLLDTLKAVNGTPGEMGKKRLTWLQEELDKRKDKPAIIMLHHNPKTGKQADSKFDGWGLIDTDDLFAVAKPRKHVKAMIFGHTHHWNVDTNDGIHLINLPALGRIFQKDEPLGWVDATLQGDGMTIELRSLDTTHKAHGEVHDLKWRT